MENTYCTGCGMKDFVVPLEGPDLPGVIIAEDGLKSYKCQSCGTVFHVAKEKEEPAPLEILNEVEDAKNVFFEKDGLRLATVPQEAMPDKYFGFDPNGYDFAFWVREDFAKKVKASEAETLLEFIVAFRKKWMYYKQWPETMNINMGEAVGDLALQFITRQATKEAFRSLLDKGLLFDGESDGNQSSIL